MKSTHTLTKQERNVLLLLATGRRNAKRADELCISTRTVENHLYHIFDKLGVSSRTEAALHALQTGLNSNSDMSGISHDKADNSDYTMSIG